MAHEGVAHNRSQWQAIVNSVITLSPLKDGEFIAQLSEYYADPCT
jgi:hypothetical protein